MPVVGQPAILAQPLGGQQMMGAQPMMGGQPLGGQQPVIAQPAIGQPILGGGGLGQPMMGLMMQQPGMSQREWLEVFVDSARGLPKTELIGRSDPYCIITFRGESKRTIPKKSTQEPIWDEKFSFDLPTSWPADVLVAELYDKDLITKDDFMGRTEIRLAEIEQDLRSSGSATITRSLAHPKHSGELKLRFVLHREGGSGMMNQQGLTGQQGLGLGHNHGGDLGYNHGGDLGHQEHHRKGLFGRHKHDTTTNDGVTHGRDHQGLPNKLLGHRDNTGTIGTTDNRTTGY